MPPNVAAIWADYWISSHRILIGGLFRGLKYVSGIKESETFKIKNILLPMLVKSHASPNKIDR